MSDFKEIIDYLRFHRRQEAFEQSNCRIAAKVDLDYTTVGIPHEDDLLFVDKIELENTDLYKNVGQEIEGNLYILDQNYTLFYYIKKIDSTNLFRRIPLELSTDWESIDPEDLKMIKLDAEPVFYYDVLNQIIIAPYLNEAIVFPDRFGYRPNDVPSEGDYLFNFKDHEGYELGLSDLFLRTVMSSAAQTIINLAKNLVNFTKKTEPGLVHLLPRIQIRATTYTLTYNYFQYGIPADSTTNKPALTLVFKSYGAMAEFLNQTIFYALHDIDNFIDNNPITSNSRELFIEDYIYYLNSNLRFGSYNQMMEALYFVPIFLFKKIDINFLWDTLTKIVENFVINVETNTEDIVIRILEGLAESYENKNIFLGNLIYKKTRDKEPLLERLLYRVDGQNNQKMISLLWKIWFASGYKEIDPENNKLISITENSPVILDYRSNQKLGFHLDNAGIKWNINQNMINVVLVVGTGVYQTFQTPDGEGGKETTTKEINETFQYIYHPFSPIAIINADNPAFLFSDPEQQNQPYTLLPAFLLYAHSESAFWQNWFTAAEYTVDILTTLSGFGNILKVGRLAKIIKAGHTLIGKTKTATRVIKGVKTVAGVVEVSSGAGNALLKLLDLNDTDFGREITKYLFYLEMLSLSGELTLAIHTGLKKSAKKLVEKTEDLAKLEKQLDDLLAQGKVTRNQADDLLIHFDEVAEVERKLGDFIMHSGDDISESSIKYIVKQVRESTGLKNFNINLVDRNNEKYQKLFEQWQKGGGYGFFKPTSGEFGLKLYKGIKGEGPQIYLFAGKTVDEWGVAKNITFTKYTTQHELFHVEMFMYLKRKTPNYMKYWNEIPTYIHEQYVLNRLLKAKNWKQEDLITDLKIINKNRIDFNPKLGDITLEDLKKWKFEFELEKIGIKIQ